MRIIGENTCGGQRKTLSSARAYVADSIEANIAIKDGIAKIDIKTVTNTEAKLKTLAEGYAAIL